jgi:hypothetical protein
MRRAALLTLLLLVTLPLVSGCAITRKQKRDKFKADLSDDVNLLLAEANGLLVAGAFGDASLRFEKLFTMKPGTPNQLLQIRSGLFECRLHLGGSSTFAVTQREEREAAKAFFDLWLVYPHEPEAEGYGELSDLARLAALVLTAEAAESDATIGSGPDSAIPALGLVEEEFALYRIGCGPGASAQWTRTREQRVVEQDEQQYDVLTVGCHGGPDREFWFDLTIFNRLLEASRGEVEPPPGFTQADARRIVTRALEKAFGGN